MRRLAESACVLALSLAPLAASAAPQSWVVLVREYPGDEGQTRELLRDDAGFWASAETLSDWRLQPAADAREAEGTRWYALDSVPGLKQEFDAGQQAMTLDLSAVPRAARVISVAAREPAAPTPVSLSGFVNADALLSAVGGGVSTAAQFEGGFSGAAGRAGGAVLLHDLKPTRLETFFAQEDPQDMTTLRLGDTVSRPGSWGRALRFAGVQYGRDFSLQPAFATFPQPVLRGDAVLPSNLEVFVNGQRRAATTTGAGPFELTDIPTLSGAGEAQVVVRDNLGRESRVSRPFYVSPSLLKPGLSDFSLESGWLRRDYGLASFNYGDFFAAATLRRGLSMDFTAELRAETQPGSGAVGGGGTWVLGDIGLFDVSAAFGASAGLNGVQTSLGFERDVPGSYSFALRTQWASPGFSMLGLGGRALPERKDFVRVSVQPHARGSVSALYSRDVARDGPDTELRALAYGVQLGESGLLNLGVSQTCAPDCETSARLDVSWSFGGRASASLSHELRELEQRTRLDVQQDSGTALGGQWRAGLERDHRLGDLRAQLSALWRGERGNLSAEVERSDDTRYRVGASSALAWIDGEAFWTRPVNGSFAVVEAGLPGLDIYADGRPVAVTDGEGRALIPDLRAWESNRLSLAAAQIPIEYDLRHLNLCLVPRSRSGVLADFGLREAAAP